MKRPFHLAALILFATATLGWAQPLANLAPADTVLSLGMQTRPGEFGTLSDDVAALDWERAGETLETLTTFLGERTDDPNFKSLLDVYSMLFASINDPTAALSEEFLGDLATCPAYIEATEAAQAAYQGNYASVPVDALLTFGVSSFNPVPTVVGLMRVDEGMADVQQASFDAYVSCMEASGDLERLEQEGVPLYVMGDGSDLPLVIGRVDNIYLFGTSPEPLRGVIRRTEGSSEPSLADSALYQRAATLDAGESQLSLTLDFAALADVLEGFGSMAASSPDEDYLLERGVAFLRTLGGYAGILSATPEGLLFENVTAVNPAGGDAALASLLLCEDCSVGSPFLAPDTSLATSVYRLPLESIFDYVQGLLDAAPPELDVSVNLRDTLREEFDFDVDVALFDWLGAEGYSVVLEPVDTDLRTFLYGQEQVTVIPVASQAAAEAGFEEFRRALTPLFDEAMASDEDIAPFLSQIASDSVTYKDETYTHYRFSINSDFGVGFLDNYLVIGTPSSALETVIDTFKGDTESLLESESYQSATEATPGSVLGRGYADVGRQFGAAADFFDLLSQPAAFALSTALTVAELDNTSVTDTPNLEYDADLTGIEATPFDVTTAPAVAEDTFTNEVYGTRYYNLTGLGAGDEVAVTLNGLSDAILSLIDENRSVYTNESYAIGSEAVLTFTAEAGVTYWLEVLNYSEEEEPFRLSVTRTPADAPAEETIQETTEEPAEPTTPPTFSDLLHLTDLVPATLRILGEHVGVNSSYTETRDGAIYHHSLTRIDW